MNIRKHASIRIRERCSLTVREVKEKLENDQYVLFGMDGKHQHKLIYSEFDDKFFVVVQDENNHDVITVMPLHWHGKWEISPELLNMAKQHLGVEEEVFEKPLDLPLKLGIIANVKRIRYRIVPYNGKKIPSTKTISVKVGEFDENDIIALGYSDNAFSKEAIQQAVENPDCEFVKNLRVYAEEQSEKNYWDETEDDETVISFCLDVNGSSFKAKSLGTIERLKEMA